MKATDQLRHEHEAATVMLNILGRAVAKLEAGTEVDPDHLDQMLEFVTVFLDSCHHGKEETHLFPALEAVGVPREGGPIGVMLREHNMGRGYVQSLGDAVAKFKKGDRAAVALIAESARNYIRHLTQHIEKENQVLFPMADARLSPATQDALLNAFDRWEGETIGAGRHAEFHRMLDRLQGLYPS